MYACMQHIARAFSNHEECSNPGKILSWWHISYSCRLRYETTGNKKRVTCFATLLQNELKSDVARFITHIKPFLQQIRLLTGLNMDGKTCNIAIQLVLLPCCKTSYTFLFAIFFPTFRSWWNVFLVKRWRKSVKFSFILKKKINMLLFVRKKAVSKNPFSLILSEEDNRKFK